MGCPGCLLTEIELQQHLQDTIQKAKNYAVQIQKMVIVYQSGPDSYRYMEAEAARSNNLIAVQYITHLQRIVNG